MSFRRITFFTFLILGAAMISLPSGKLRLTPSKPPLAAKNPPTAEIAIPPREIPGSNPPLPPLPTKIAAPPPELPKPLPEPPEDEIAIAKERVDAALARLDSPDPAHRLDGVEQLGAYADPAAETALAQTLGNDPEPEVRRAAAQNLRAVRQPGAATIAALFTALEDADDNVRGKALATLERFHAASDADSESHRVIWEGFQEKAGAPGTPWDVREALDTMLRNRPEAAR